MQLYSELSLPISDKVIIGHRVRQVKMVHQKAGLVMAQGKGDEDFWCKKWLLIIRPGKKQREFKS